MRAGRFVTWFEGSSAQKGKKKRGGEGDISRQVPICGGLTMTLDIGFLPHIVQVGILTSKGVADFA